MRDLDALVPACAAMHAEEVGIDPMERDAAGYRERIRELVEQKRSVIRVVDGQIAAKCEYSAVTNETVQLMGVWTQSALPPPRPCPRAAARGLRPSARGRERRSRCSSTTSTVRPSRFTSARLSADRDESRADLVRFRKARPEHCTIQRQPGSAANGPRSGWRLGNARDWHCQVVQQRQRVTASSSAIPVKTCSCITAPSRRRATGR